MPLPTPISKICINRIRFAVAAVVVHFAAPAVAQLTSLSEATSWLEARAQQLVRQSRTTMNNGTSAFIPQAGGGYDAFWLRDYAYMLEGCLNAFSNKELTASCRVFVNAMRKDGAGVDCVKLDGTPIYQPAGGSMGANPVADGSQFTVEVAWYTWQKTGDRQWLSGIIDKLAKTMKAAPRNPQTGLVYIKPGDPRGYPGPLSLRLHRHDPQRRRRIVLLAAVRPGMPAVGRLDGSRGSSG